ncbi:MAG: NAD(P)/FAD-dependent oxidoreductase, partial [Gaiellales bacterium]
MLIVGGGAVGACIALELSRRGVSTSLIERERELGRGCSAGNMGLICPGHSAPLATPENLVVGLRYMFRPDGPLYLRPRPAMAGWLARYLWACRPANAAAGVRVMREISELSLRLHAELASEGLNETFVRRGTLSLCETEAGLEALRAEARGHSAGGLEARLLDGGEARDLEPSLGRHVRGAVFYPNEAHCDSLSFVQAVGRAAAEAGADVRTGVEVLALRRRSGRVEGVDSTEGTVRAGTVVLAGGSWSGALASTAGAFVPVQGGKGYHVEIDTGGGDPVIP